MGYEILEASTDEEILACYPVISVLRPHIQQDNLVNQVREQFNQGYHLLYIKEGSKVVSFMGYRIQTYLWSGKMLYIDDLCTLPTAKGNGYAGTLLDFIIQHAKDQQCKAVDLDSGYTRNDAHRLYLNKHFKIVFHHFHLSL